MSDMLGRLAGRAEQAEVFEIDSESTSVGFEANKLKSFEVNQTRGVALRVVKDGRLGFAASSDMEADDRLIENALESAQHGDPVPVRFPGPARGPDVEVYDPRLAELPTDGLIEVGREMIATITEGDDKALVRVELQRQVRSTVVRNSNGGEVSTLKSPFSFALLVERVQQDDVLLVHRFYSTASWSEEYRAVAQALAEQLRLAREITTLRSGRMPVLFSPPGAVVLGLPLMLGLNGKDVYRGISPMAGKVGEKLFDEKLTLVDDPTINGRPGSASHDDEGVPHRRNVLIDGGVVCGFLYDLKTAVQAGAEPTGNGERGLFSPPSPSFTNLVLQAGTTPVREIIRGLDEALLVESPLGVGQGNVMSGAFSNSLSLAFKIEKGEIIGRVKDVSIAGNVYTDLKRIEALSREAEWVYGGMQLPYILLPALNVVTKA
ncbi:MAG: TldD/PmbA family protein [Anaerolineae bacterium]|nr:TldD/PmbA family protein [Anaerolineae bacterium]